MVDTRLLRKYNACKKNRKLIIRLLIGDTCDMICRAFDIPYSSFYDWNPTLGWSSLLENPNRSA